MIMRPALDAWHRGNSPQDEAMVVRGTGLVVIAAALAALAGCATTTTRANLSNSAKNLEYNAAALVHDTVM